MGLRETAARGVGACGSWTCAGFAALPLGLAAIAAFVARLDARFFAEANSVRMFAALLGTSLLVGFVRSASLRQFATALARLAALLVLGGFVLHATRRLVSELRLGEGEPPVQMSTNAPPWLRSAPLRFEYPGGERQGGPVELRVNGDSIRVVAGAITSLPGGFELQFVDLNHAPAFKLAQGSGAVIEEGLIKVDPTDSSAFFQVGTLPHRFYLWGAKGAQAVAPGEVAPRLHLRITRGKLILVDREVDLGEAAAFDAMTFSYRPGARWIRLRVARALNPWPFASAIVISVASAAVWLRRRSR